VPLGARPHPLDLKPLCQLTEDRLNAKAKVFDPTGPLGPRLAAALTKWRDQPDALFPQPRDQLRVPVVNEGIQVQGECPPIVGFHKLY